MNNAELIARARAEANETRSSSNPLRSRKLIYRLADALAEADVVADRIRAQRDANLVRSNDNFNRARLAEKKIDAAPHDQRCDTWYVTVDGSTALCNCWKSIRSFGVVVDDTPAMK